MQAEAERQGSCLGAAIHNNAMISERLPSLILLHPTVTVPPVICESVLPMKQLSRIPRYQNCLRQGRVRR